MGRNGSTYQNGSGDNCHNCKVAKTKELVLELGALVREDSSEAIREDLGSPDLCIQNVQMDDPVSQRTPSHHRWVEAWKR